MPQFKVDHTRYITIVTDYIVESKDEFFTEDEAIDVVIDFLDEKPLPDGVKVKVEKSDENDFDEDFDVETVEEDE